MHSCGGQWIRDGGLPAKRRKNCFTRARPPVSPHWNASGVTPHHFLDAAWDFVSTEHSVLRRRGFPTRCGLPLPFRILLRIIFIKDQSIVSERNNFYAILYSYKKYKIILHIIDSCKWYAWWFTFCYINR